MIHGIVCSFLGDGEVDIGKTARWLLGFVDTVFFFDQQGDPARKYAVDYAKTFPEAEFSYAKQSIFDDAPAFRAAAFAAADKAWRYDEDDWVIFVDATESLSTNLPYDQLELVSGGTRLKYLDDEVDAASGDVISFPWLVFLHQGTITEMNDMPVDPYLAADLEDRLDHTTDPDEIARIKLIQGANNSVIYWTCQPHVMADPPLDRLDRMFLVSTARTPGLVDWEALDDPTAAVGTAAVSCGIVSYGYARYSETDYHDPDLWVEENDLGFANRLLMQQFHDVGLPEVYATADPAGVHAAVGGFATSPAYCYYIDQYAMAQTIPSPTPSP